MSRTLSTGDLGREIRSENDYFFKGETVPNNTTSNSNGLLIGKTQDALEIVCKVATALTVADTKAITFNIQESSDDGVADAYATIATPYTLTSSGGDLLAADTELFRYTPSRDKEIYIRVQWVSTETGESGTVDVYPAYVSR